MNVPFQMHIGDRLEGFFYTLTSFAPQTISLQMELGKGSSLRVSKKVLHDCFTVSIALTDTKKIK